jgi:hypothetical protein
MGALVRSLRGRIPGLVAFLTAFIWARWQRGPADPFVLAPEAAPEPPPGATLLGAAAPRRGRGRHDSEDLVWHFRGAILDRLDEYFVCFKRLHAFDRSASAVFAKLGFTITADRFINPEHPSQRQIGHERPTWGGILFPRGGMGDDSDRVVPSFVYFQKLRRLPHVQAWRGDIYELVGIFDDRSGTAERYTTRGVGGVGRCYLGVPEGHATLLKEEIGGAEHSVVPHTRHLSEVKTTDVRAHYRGLRTFEWNGYQVHIVWPKHTFVQAFDQPGVDEETIPPATRAGYMPADEAAATLGDVLDR